MKKQIERTKTKKDLTEISQIQEGLSNKIWVNYNFTERWKKDSKQKG